ncbi:unnamed protein product [Dracunculus medinensis]|uniref:Dual specificity protein phosphatase 14 n=1 Tax=Dracunculus medinensis TaxID=318479 RepID=A0A0N4UB41_DRAME|nr:unnamed protein product [Dracunculus medinensis]
MTSVSFKVDPEYAKISEIIPGLFICGVTALKREILDRYGISFIINATTEVPNLRSLGHIPRVKLWLEDTPQANIYQHLEIYSDQIERILSDGGRVLVHCVAGVSRSASICLAYLTKYKCRSLRDAYRLMSLKRPLVRPNLGFWRQLIQFEQEIKRSVGSVRLILVDSQPENYLPDVYLRKVYDENDEESGNENFSSVEKRPHLQRSRKNRFRPVLEPLFETTETVGVTA